MYVFAHLGIEPCEQALEACLENCEALWITAPGYPGPAYGNTQKYIECTQECPKCPPPPPPKIEPFPPEQEPELPPPPQPPQPPPPLTMVAAPKQSVWPAVVAVGAIGLLAAVVSQ
jgi:hypothetical protein